MASKQGSSEMIWKNSERLHREGDGYSAEPRPKIRRHEISKYSEEAIPSGEGLMQAEVGEECKRKI